MVKRSAKASWAQQLLQWLATVKSYLNLDTEHPDDIERNIPDWVFPTQQNLPTTHQSLPDGVLVMPIEGRGRHLDPKQIPIRGKDIHLVEFKFCSDINPQQTLEKAHNQHQPLIQRLIQRLQQGARGTSRSNKVTLHTSWSRGHNLQSVQHNSSTKSGHPPTQSAPTSHCTTLPRNKKLQQDHKNKKQNTINNDNSANRLGDLIGEFTIKAAGFKRARRRPDRMADNPPDPH